MTQPAVPSACAHFHRDQSGAVAVEFALTALPFFTLVIALLELSFYFAVGTVLEGATFNASRMIRTGQVQVAADPEQAFRDALCQQASIVVNCDDIQLEVIAPPGNTFNDIDGIPPEFDDDGNLISQGFDPGGISDVVVIRTAYRYQFMVPFVAPLFSQAADSGVTLVSTVTMRNEPYAFED